MLGLHQAPSKELIDAEVRLAEVCAARIIVRAVTTMNLFSHLLNKVLLKREELEARKKKEYRLTAFTGDLQ